MYVYTETVKLLDVDTFKFIKLNSALEVVAVVFIFSVCGDIM